MKQGKLKSLISICLTPITIIFNPITVWIAKKVSNVFWHTYNNLFLTHTLTKFSCSSYVRTSNLKQIHLKGTFTCGRGEWIECIDHYRDKKYSPYLEIGCNVSLGDYSHIGCLNKIVIGDNTLIGARCLIEDHNHGDFRKGVDDEIKSEKVLYSKGPIIIGKNVWIGENVCILANVHIGDNAVIGAGSVVTHNIEANSIYAGNPARKIR